MLDDELPVMESADVADSSFVHNVMEKAFSTTPVQPLVQPDSPPQINPAQASNDLPAEEEAPAPLEADEPTENSETEETLDEDYSTDSKVRPSRATGKKFADMRVKIRTFEKENRELRAQIEELKKTPSDSNAEELEKYKSIIKGYAYTETPEYKKEVAEPWAKTEQAIKTLVSSAGITMTSENWDALNSVATNEQLDAYDKEEAYENLASDLGLEGLDVMKFTKWAKFRDALIQKNTEYLNNAQQYVDKLMEKATGVKRYEVNLDNYVLDKMQARAKELGLTTEITEDHLKEARHFAHKIENGSFMDAILATIAREELAEARATIEALETKVAKLRGVKPKPSKGAQGFDKNPASTQPQKVNDIIENAFRWK